MWKWWTRNVTDIYWTFNIKRLAGGWMHRCIKSLFKKLFQTLKRPPALLKLPMRRNKGPWHTCLSPVGRVTSGDWVFRPLTITPSSCRVWSGGQEGTAEAGTMILHGEYWRSKGESVRIWQTQTAKNYPTVCLWAKIELIVISMTLTVRLTGKSFSFQGFIPILQLLCVEILGPWLYLLPVLWIEITETQHHLSW